MVNEHNCNNLAITSFLIKDLPEIANKIKAVCKLVDVKLTNINNANDYWCRDFMPIQICDTKFIQFSYDPSYYKHPKYQHLKTNIYDIDFKWKREVDVSKIVLDGGNVCYFNDVAIITDKVFKDNQQYKKQELVKELHQILQLKELFIIPALPNDITGHADGMIRFVNENTLLLNDFSLISGKRYWQRLKTSLKSFNLILLPNDMHLNKKHDDATGDYINMLFIKDHILMPQYGSPTDKLTKQIIQTTFPQFTVHGMFVNVLATKGGVLHCASWNYNKEL